MSVIHVETRVGLVAIEADDHHVTRVGWERPPETARTPLLKEAAAQLRAYFDGRLQAFDLPLKPEGGAFAQAVYEEMLAIPYGETSTYGELAHRIGGQAQPVGQACGRNPMPIIIPCHRVLSATGLGGYSGAGGLDTKIALLRLEGGYPFLV